MWWCHLDAIHPPATHYIHAIHSLASRGDLSNRQLHYGTDRVTRVQRLHCRVHDCRYFLSHPSACIWTVFIRLVLPLYADRLHPLAASLH